MTLINRILAPSYLGDFLALIIGTLLTLAFAPFNFFPFGIILPALLLGLWLFVPPSRAFRRGFLFGMGFFGSGVYWIYISIHTYGNTIAPIALLITGSFIALLAIFPAIAGYLTNHYFPYNNYTKLYCAFPAIWVFLEWIRTWIATGFPWLLLGYSQLSSPLKGYAPILSVLGVSLVILWSSAALVNAMLKFYYLEYKAAYYNLLFLALLWVIGAGLSLIPWTHSTGPKLTVSLIQGDISQSLKWEPEHVETSLQRYQTLTAPEWGRNIIIWPEAAIPVAAEDAYDFISKLKKTAHQHNTTLITGVPLRATNNRYYNGIIAIGNGRGVYLKHSLVPFGEYLPMEKLIQDILDTDTVFSHFLKKTIGLFSLPMSSFVSGKLMPTPLYADNIKLSSFICYEIAYFERVRAESTNTGIILTVSNDAWFGRSIAQAQHLQIAAMRALENGRPVLFSSNSGITAMINTDGHIIASAPPYQPAILNGTIQAYSGLTPWQRYKLDPLLAILLALLVVARYQHKK